MTTNLTPEILKSLELNGVNCVHGILADGGVVSLPVDIDGIRNIRNHAMLRLQLAVDHSLEPNQIDTTIINLNLPARDTIGRTNPLHRVSIRAKTLDSLINIVPPIWNQYRNDELEMEAWIEGDKGEPDISIPLTELIS